VARLDMSSNRAARRFTAQLELLLDLAAPQSGKPVETDKKFHARGEASFQEYRRTCA